MSHVNREDVERRLARLQDDWGEFPVEFEREEVPAEGFDSFLADARDGYTGGGYVWAVRPPDWAPDLSESMHDSARQTDDRVLLVLGREYEWWSAAGGGREDGETYEEAAVREVDEETSVDVSITGVARAERFESSPDDDRDVTAHTLFVVFEGRYEGGHIQVQPGELNGAAWFRELPAKVHPIVEPLADTWHGDRAQPPEAESS
jgi:ADP-ribose pyrophosphatase YjhB (NUDIX family)